MTEDPIVTTEWQIRHCVSKSLGRVWCAYLIAGPDFRHTSPIAKIEGNLVTTRSGTVYQLEGDLRTLSADPFYLADGTAYPEGADVPLVPPDQGATLDVLTAFFGASCLVLLYNDGDYETHPVDRLEWAKKRTGPNPGRIYLNGVEVTDFDGEPLSL